MNSIITLFEQITYLEGKAFCSFKYSCRCSWLWNNCCQLVTLFRDETSPHWHERTPFLFCFLCSV